LSGSRFSLLVGSSVQDAPWQTAALSRRRTRGLANKPTSGKVLADLARVSIGVLMVVAFSLSDGRADAYGLRAPLLARVPCSGAGSKRRAGDARRFDARLVQRARGRGGEQPAKWGPFPMARPRVLGDAGSNRREREMKGLVVRAGKGERIWGRALER
jgi:hypothetical protein